MATELKDYYLDFDRYQVFSKGRRRRSRQWQERDLSRPGIIFNCAYPLKIVMVWGSPKYLAEAVSERGCPHRIYLPQSFSQKTWKARQMVLSALHKEYPDAEIETSVYPLTVHVTYAWDGHSLAYYYPEHRKARHPRYRPPKKCTESRVIDIDFNLTARFNMFRVRQ